MIVVKVLSKREWLDLWLTNHAHTLSLNVAAGVRSENGGILVRTSSRKREHRPHMK